MHNFTAIILMPIFIIILLVVYQAVKAAFNFGTAGTFTMSVCVSLLSVIGMSRFLKGSLEIILLPYALLGIFILVLLVMFYCRGYLKKIKERVKTRNKKEFTHEIKTTKRKENSRQLRRR